MSDLRTAAQQALEALEAFLSDELRPHEAAKISAALRAALTQQDEPDHETRAELAEQQVVQLAEERDHYRNLWQKAQQAEPVEQLAELQAMLRAEVDRLIAAGIQPQRKLVPLTEEKKRALADKFLSCQPESYEVSGVFDLISAVERAHGIKE